MPQATWRTVRGACCRRIQCSRAAERLRRNETAILDELNLPNAQNSALDARRVSLCLLRQGTPWRGTAWRARVLGTHPVDCWSMGAVGSLAERRRVDRERLPQFFGNLFPIAVLVPSAGDRCAVAPGTHYGKYSSDSSKIVQSPCAAGLPALMRVISPCSLASNMESACRSGDQVIELRVSSSTWTACAPLQRVGCSHTWTSTRDPRRGRASAAPPALPLSCVPAHAADHISRLLPARAAGRQILGT